MADWTEGIEDALTYIEMHLTEELEIREIAKRAFVSPFYFQRIFAALCGVGVGEYIRNRRLTQAGEELASTNAKVIDVAAKYGYDSPDSFNRAFRRFHGISPSAARKKAASLRAYAIAYTIKMSKKGDHRIEGYYDFVVPPLEGFWWQDGVDGVNYTDKCAFNWISVIRLPVFVTKVEFDWAVAEATRKKKLDCSMAEFLTIDEGECVQIMHLGSFDDEPATVSIMDAYLEANGYENDFSATRLHHEIYLSDARKVAPEKWKTVIRHPIKKR